MVYIRSQAITNTNLNLLMADLSLPTVLVNRREDHQIKSINQFTKKRQRQQTTRKMLRLIHMQFHMRHLYIQLMHLPLLMKHLLLHMNPLTLQMFLFLLLKNLTVSCLMVFQHSSCLYYQCLGQILKISKKRPFLLQIEAILILLDSSSKRSKPSFYSQASLHYQTMKIQHNLSQVTPVLFQHPTILLL